MNDEMSGSKRRRSTNNNEGVTVDGSSGSGRASDKWSHELHRCFVEAIYDAGVSQSSPSVILENMSNRPASLTSERVKSHLQKYRKNKQKSKDDFMQDYDSFMRKALTVGGAGGGASHVIMPPAAMIEMMGGGKPSGGDIAAFLAYSVMTGDTKSSTGKSISSIGIAKDSQDYLKNFAGTHVPFPQLTEEEKRSPLGISMVYVMGLFSSLSQHMMHERRKRFRRDGSSENEGTALLETTAANISMNSNSSSNANAFTSKPQAPPTHAQGFTHHHHQQQQQQQQQANMAWGIPEQQRNVLLQHQEAQDSGARALAMAADTTGGDLGQGPPRPSRGFFHPILSKAEMTDARNTATDWNNGMLQPTGTSVFQAHLPGHTQPYLGQGPPQQSRGPPPQHQGPPQNRRAPSDSGPYAQV